MNDKTYIKYNKVSFRGESYFRPEIVAKRNDPRVNRHQQNSYKAGELTVIYS